MKIIARPWTPQDLIDDLQSIIDEESDDYFNTRRTTLEMALSYLKEHFSESKWIPVSERLPDIHGTFIVAIYVRSRKRKYSDSAVFDPVVKRWRTHSFWGKGMKVTHWMPLPEPPKENANDT